MGTGLVVWLGLKDRGGLKSVIMALTTEMNYRCNYRTGFSNINTM